MKPLICFCCWTLLVAMTGCSAELKATRNPSPAPMIGPFPVRTPSNDETSGGTNVSETNQKITKTDAEWRKILTPEQYRITRERGTEAAFTGAYWNTHTPGVYECVGCGQELFDSETKFESGTGWPSFYRQIADGRVTEEIDQSHRMKRVEVHCSRCGAHLGHVFTDGPPPTGLRYCINSPALRLRERK